MLLTNNPQLTERIAKTFQEKGVPIKATLEGRDLGADRAAKNPRKMQTHRDRVAKAKKRFHKVGKKLAKLGTKSTTAFLEQGAMASIMYGAQVHGVNPTELEHIRRAYSRALRRPWAGEATAWDYRPTASWMGAPPLP